MDDLAQRIAQVSNDHEHGSRWLVKEALLVLRDLARESPESQDEQLRLLYKSGQELALARPAMAALSSAMARVLDVQGGTTAIADAIQTLLAAYETAPQQIAAYAQAFLHGDVLTCSLSGTVSEVLVANQERITRVTVLEGRPLYEGREIARILSQHGLVVTLITDAQAAIFLPQTDCVVVGADSVLADGGILNKAGTALLAWAAHGYKVPFYVLGETLKISPQHWSSNPARRADNLAMLEAKASAEVLEQPIPGVNVHNFYFDYTPPHLLTKLISEHGVLTATQIKQIARSTQQQLSTLLQKQV